MIIGYARVSTDGQTLDAQQASLAAAGAERVFAEKVSGAVTDRKALAKAIDQVKTEAGAAVAKEDFAAAMGVIAKLRPAVDAFFDKVKVNDDEPKVRENRLKLLNEIRAATRAVADFSKIEG